MMPGSVCATHEDVDCSICTVYHGTGGETSEGILPVTTQPDTDAPPTVNCCHAAICICTDGLHDRCCGERRREYLPSDAPQEGRHPDVKRLASWLRGSYGHAFPRVDWEADAAEVLDLFASDYSAPQEGRPTNEAALGESRDLFGTLYGSGRPTTPQTEAGYREAVPDLLRMLVTDPSVSASFREAANRWIDEAAAGALPSVEVAARKVYHGRIGYENPHDPDILALGVALYPHRARLAAAPPEASER
jgi:hypothetical protein